MLKISYDSSNQNDDTETLYAVRVNLITLILTIAYPHILYIPP